MIDNEIVKALECCNGLAPTDEVDCALCPFCDYDAHTKCTEELAKNVLDLVNRQKAEIERLKDYNKNLLSANVGLSCGLLDEIQRARAEAIKEFAERLKGWALAEYENPERVLPECVFVSVESINDLLEEMTEETK